MLVDLFFAAESRFALEDFLHRSHVSCCKKLRVKVLLFDLQRLQAQEAGIFNVRANGLIENNGTCIIVHLLNSLQMSHLSLIHIF